MNNGDGMRATRALPVAAYAHRRAVSILDPHDIGTEAVPLVGPRRCIHGIQVHKMNTREPPAVQGPAGTIVRKVSLSCLRGGSLTVVISARRPDRKLKDLAASFLPSTKRGSCRPAST